MNRKWHRLRKVTKHRSPDHEATARTGEVTQPPKAAMVILVTPTYRNANEFATTLRHEGIRVGEIIAYRAWRVFKPHWWWKGDDRLHSVLMQDYVWHPNEPASGDVQTHGIYSFRDVIRSNEEYSYSVSHATLLFGRVNIWGEIIEHENGYRSQFGKIVSLDYGEPDLLEKFQKIYRLNQVPAS